MNGSNLMEFFGSAVNRTGLGSTRPVLHTGSIGALSNKPKRVGLILETRNQILN